MFGHINRRTAIFAAQRQPLQHAQKQHQCGRCIADAGRRRDQPHPCSGNPHQRNRYQKGIFAAKPVAQKTEQHRPQGTKTKAHREACPHQQNLQGGTARRKKCLADDAGQCSVNEEIIPFENGTGGTGGNDQTHIRSTRRNMRVPFRFTHRFIPPFNSSGALARLGATGKRRGDETLANFRFRYARNLCPAGIRQANRPASHSWPRPNAPRASPTELPHAARDKPPPPQ